MGYLTKKCSCAKLLIFTDLIVILGGYLMTVYTTQAGTWQFTVGFLVSQILTSCNFVITQTMLMSKMEPDSRGVITSVQMVFYTLGVLASSIALPVVQGHFGANYATGSQAIFFLFYFLLTIYWVLLLIYVFFSVICKCVDKKKASRDELVSYHQIIST